MTSRYQHQPPPTPVGSLEEKTEALLKIGEAMGRMGDRNPKPLTAAEQVTLENMYALMTAPSPSRNEVFPAWMVDRSGLHEDRQMSAKKEDKDEEEY